MKNFKQPGDIVELPAPTGGCLSGDFILLGALFGVAQVTAAQGVLVPCVREGVFELPKETGTGWTKGDRLFWDATNKRFTKTATGNVQPGVAFADAAAGDAVGNVSLNDLAAELELQAAIADIALAAVTGVDGTGSNAASKADVDARFAALQAKVNAILAALRGAPVIAP